MLALAKCPTAVYAHSLRMKRAVALLGLAWFSGCSFPEYEVERAVPTTGTAGTSGASSTGGAGATEMPSCTDNQRNGDETGIDCGMTGCSKACPPGQGCDADVDCEGGKCTDRVCRAASCEDLL